MKNIVKDKGKGIVAPSQEPAFETIKSSQPSRLLELSIAQRKGKRMCTIKPIPYMPAILNGSNKPCPSTTEVLTPATAEHTDNVGNRDKAMVEYGHTMHMDVNYRAAVDRLNILPTLTLDTATLDLLGIKSSVMWLLGKMKIRIMIEKIGATYEELTREFLSTVVLKYPDSSLYNAITGVMEFTAGGKPYTMSIKQLCDLFKFPMYTNTHFPHTTEHHGKWVDFASENFAGGRSNASQIMHPALRYIQRIIACSLFDRNEGSALTVNEFFMMLLPFHNHTPVCNMGSLLAQSLVKVKHYALSTRETTPSTFYGGIITVIMQACGVDLSGHTPLAASNPLDLAYLHKMKFISGWVEESNQFGYIYPITGTTHKVVLLPCADLSDMKVSSPSFVTTTLFQTTPERPLIPIRNYLRKIGKLSKCSRRRDIRRPAPEGPSQPDNPSAGSNTKLRAKSHLAKVSQHITKMENATKLLVRMTEQLKKMTTPDLFTSCRIDDTTT